MSHDSQSAEEARRGGAQESRRWIDLDTLMAIQDLQWRAKTVVDGFQNGLHRSPLHGFSVEFSEYRPFSAGDDPRSIDWKLYARSDRYFIKKFEEETNRRCYLVVDQSRSMGYASIGYSKLEYARTLSATIAFHLIRQRDAVGVITFDSAVGEVLTARFRTGQWKRLLGMLERSCSGNTTDIAVPLEQVASLVRHRSLIVIVSDLLVAPEQLQGPLAFLRARRHEVVMLRVLDPREVEFQSSKPILMRDVETGAERYVDPAAAKETYQRRFREHEGRLRAIAEPLGVSMVSMRTDQPLEASLYEFLAQRERSGVVHATASSCGGAPQNAQGLVRGLGAGR